MFRRLGLYGGMALVLLGTILPVGAAHAQSAGTRPPLDLMTSPLPLNITTKPGVPVTADIRVKNNGNQTETLKVELLKFGANGNSGQPQIQERTPRDLYFNWVQFSENTFNAEPNVWKTVRMKISPPKEAAFGYYYAVLFSRATPGKAANGQSAVEGGVASLVLLNVDAPGSRRQAEVVSMQATHKVYEFLPAEFSVDIKNSGNIHLSPTGSMFIKRGNEQVAAMDFNNEQGNILPGTDRSFSIDWNDGFPSYQTVKKGNSTEQKLSWDFSKIQKLRFGRYTATLVAVYDDGQRDVPIQATVSFWIIPWRILGVILLIALFIGGGLWAFSRFIWRGLRRQALAPAPAADPDSNTLAAALNKGKNEGSAATKPNEPSEEAGSSAPVAIHDKGSATAAPHKNKRRKKSNGASNHASYANQSFQTEEASPQRPSHRKHAKRRHDQTQPSNSEASRTPTASTSTDYRPKTGSRKNRNKKNRRRDS